MVHGGQWRERDGHQRCAHCGSLTPAEALRRMTTPGCKFSGTDKGGYKFYFTGETGDHGKFYGAHLEDLSAEDLAAFAEASRRCLGVHWKHEGSGKPPACFMPKSDSFYGWQTWGKVGPDGQPVFDEAPVPPDEDWWRNQGIL